MKESVARTVALYTRGILARDTLTHEELLFQEFSRRDRAQRVTRYTLAELYRFVAGLIRKPIVTELEGYIMKKKEEKKKATTPVLLDTKRSLTDAAPPGMA